MKDFPSIPRATGQSFEELPGAYIFDKLDGSNLRQEWTRKQGFHKFGTRTRLLDTTDPVFGPTIGIFREKLDEKLTRMAKDERWDSVVTFTEFWGVKSFAGVHEPDDPKFLTVIDISPYKKGILGPKEFLRLAEKYEFDVPRFLGQHNFTRGYVQRVRDGQIEGITFEGVVAKVGESHKLKMGKAKTQQWVDKVIEVHGAERGALIINS